MTKTLADINREAYSKYNAENYKRGYDDEETEQRWTDAWQAAADAVVHAVQLQRLREIGGKEQAVIEAAEAIMLLPAPLLSTACVEWANLEDAVEALQKLKRGTQ